MRYSPESIDGIIKNYMNSDMKSLSREEVFEALSVYHEELNVQNTELKRINEELEISRYEYERLFMSSPVGYLIIDDTGHIKKANEQACRLFENRDLQRSQFQKYLSDESQDPLYMFLQKIRDTGTTQNIEIETRSPNDNRYLKIIGDLADHNEKTTLFQLALLDETKEHIYKSEVEYLSLHDQLTGLYNRRFFEEELKRLDVERSFPLGLIIADLNGLKLINDAFGHEKGDMLLRETANILRRQLRQEEILARIGGDEFVILLPNTSEKALAKIVERIEKASSIIGIEDINLSISFGYCAKTSSAQKMNNIFKTAEERMYKEKLFKQTSQRSNVISNMISTFHEKHSQEKDHSMRVGLLAELLAKEAGLDKTTANKMKIAGILHDIGKIALDYSILRKPGPLNMDETIEVRKHSEIGYRILKSSSEFADIAEIILSHHERMDGFGYPRGLKEDDIRLESRILSICDAFDAMISERPYREKMKSEEAAAQLKSNTGSQFDYELVQLFTGKVLPLFEKAVTLPAD